MEATATTGIGAAGAFEPSLWDDYFVTYTPPPSLACTLHFSFGHPSTYICSNFGVVGYICTIYHYNVSNSCVALVYMFGNVCMQRSEEWMRQRADKLKKEVLLMFDDHSSAMSAANTLTLVDALERLGIDHLFQQQIDAAMCRVHSKETEFTAGSSMELHMSALRFRLLRQHGFFVPTGRKI